VLKLARYDGLTGLPNRSMFVDELERTLARARRSGQAFALFFIDLDRFKNINDSLGHDAGDQLLKVMAKCLSGLLRDSDLVARLGGDEFVVLLEGSDEAAALAHVGRKALAAIADPVRIDGRSFQVTGSVGISLYPQDGMDAATLLKNADAAMYLAKDSGKNNYQFYTAQLAVQSAQQFALEAELRAAIGRDELVLHYQPKVRLSDGAMVGMEALLRWMHPQRGLLAPGEFITLAEDSELILPIGQWVLDAACRQVRAWRDAGLQVPRCAVNLSARCPHASSSPTRWWTMCCAACHGKAWRATCLKSRSPKACSWPTRSATTARCRRCTAWGCTSRSTTSARATRRWPI
jgi:diguanylate cyclase (GGDEF)-like protein